jgi:hypothetical protein
MDESDPTPIHRTLWASLPSTGTVWTFDQPMALLMLSLGVRHVSRACIRLPRKPPGDVGRVRSTQATTKTNAVILIKEVRIGDGSRLRLFPDQPNAMKLLDR